MKIFLIGMPGSGKTTLGKELASHLLVEFVDLDLEIEKSELQSIAEIFTQHGEDHFRMVEARLLAEWASGSSAFVMATGGGAPCYFGGMETINKSGLSIFLDVPIPQLTERVSKNQERPLLRGRDEAGLEEKLRSLREQRLACYHQAKIIVREPSIDVVLKKISATR